MTSNERQLKAAEQEMQRLADETQKIWKTADKEERETTEEEKGTVEEHLRAIETTRQKRDELAEAVAQEKRIRDIGRSIGADDDEETDPAAVAVKKEYAQPRRPDDMGKQFVESDQYKSLVDKGFNGKWASGLVELKTLLQEGDNLFLEGGSPGAGAPLVPMDMRPGIQPILFERLTVANLLASGSTNANAINYVVETVADPGSIGTVDEGGTKPEAALEFDNVQEPVRKIASFLPVTDEMLEDAPALRAYINARLTFFVQQEEENQLLNKTGSGNDIDGLLNRVPGGNQGVTSDAQAANNADNIYAAMSVVRDAFLEPDGMVVNTDDWQELRLLKDQNDNYIAGSPFSNTGAGEPGETLWNKRVVVTSAIDQGTALVGAFATAAQLFRKGGLTVEASNSHLDYFRRNLTALRAEERLGLAVYRPEAFATADLSGS